MKKWLFLIIVLVAFLSCDMAGTDEPLNQVDPGTEIDPSGEDATSITGMIAINVESGVSDSVRAVSSLSGNVFVSAGTEWVLLSADTFSLSEGVLQASFNLSGDFDGVTTLLTLVDLEYMGSPITKAGRLLISTSEGESFNLSDLLETDQTSEDLFSWVDLAGTDAESEPQITEFEVIQDDVTTPIATLSAEFQNMEINFAGLIINKSTQLIPLDLAQGSSSLSDYAITLSPGENTVQLVAVNTYGISLSTVERVNYNAPGDDVLLITLLWDSPEAMLDLHTYYYDQVNPLNLSDFDWHNYYDSLETPVLDSDPEDAFDAYWDARRDATGSLSVTITDADDDTPIDSGSRDDMFVLNPDDDGLSFSQNSYYMRFDISGLPEITETGSYSLINVEGSFHDMGVISFTNGNGSLLVTSISDAGISGSVSLNAIGDDRDDGDLGPIDIVANFSSVDDLTALKALEHSGIGPYEKLDLSYAEGFGPIHYTLTTVDDGYYPIAVNCYDLKGDSESNFFLTLEYGSQKQSFGPYTFTEYNRSDLPIEGSGAWKRVVDIQVNDGQASFLEPAMSLNVSTHLNPGQEPPAGGGEGEY